MKKWAAIITVGIAILAAAPPAGAHQSRLERQVARQGRTIRRLERHVAYLDRVEACLFTTSLVEVGDPSSLRLMQYGDAQDVGPKFTAVLLAPSCGGVFQSGTGEEVEMLSLDSFFAKHK